jgi:hypothetical protein
MDRDADGDTMNDTQAWLPDLTGPLRWSWVQAVGPDILGLIADQVCPGEPHVAVAASSRANPLLPAAAAHPARIDRRMIWRA